MMSKSKLVNANEKIEKAVVGTYKKIENGVVGACENVAKTAVGAYTIWEDKFVDRFLRKDSESIEDAKKE